MNKRDVTREARRYAANNIRKLRELPRDNPLTILLTSGGRISPTRFARMLRWELVNAYESGVHRNVTGEPE